MLLSAAAEGGEDAVAAAPAGRSFFLVFFSCLEVGVACKNVCSSMSSFLQICHLYFPNKVLQKVFVSLTFVCTAVEVAFRP